MGPVLSFTDTGLVGGQEYYYSVSAVNSVGEGQETSEEQVTPTAPEFHIINPIDPNAGGFSWTSSIATAVILLVAVIAMLLYFRKPDTKKD